MNDRSFLTFTEPNRLVPSGSARLRIIELPRSRPRGEESEE